VSDLGKSPLALSSHPVPFPLDLINIRHSLRMWFKVCGFKGKLPGVVLAWSHHYHIPPPRIRRTLEHSLQTTTSDT
jgi:hypothetical protein